MLVTSESNPATPSRAPSILDSPTLARVERARLRLEAASGQREDSLERTILTQKQSLLAGRIPIASTTGPIKRGLLWQQRDRLFSRWKERYFVLTRDYLHCFKRASGSANERISDMGQFIFKVKLVDVEKVEWLNRRSYSAIGLLLGSREGRVLLRCDNGLEDWFELLEECTLNSKQRRQALRITQGPRSRASLAAPPSHASLYANHLGLGGTYSSAIEDWLLTRNKSINSTNHFILSDSVPDLTSAINDNHSGITTNHSTPKKIPNNSNSLSKANGNLINLSGSPNCYHHHHHNHHNSPTSRIIKNKNYDSVLIEDEEEVQLRRGNNLNGGGGFCGANGLREHGVNDNENKDSNWMYRKPLGPHDQRHSLLTDIDITACDSGLDTPPSTHRPSSYRDVYYMTPGARDSTDTGVSSSRGTLVSPGGSIRGTAHQQHTNTNGSRYSVQEKSSISVQRQWQQNNHDPQSSIRSNNKILSEFYNEINQNKYMNGNGHANTNFNGVGSGQNSIRDNRYQNPALAAIINEAQGMKFRDRSYSDIQQIPRRTWNDNSQSPKRFMGTPTRV